jgi:hypothetical protein
MKIEKSIAINKPSEEVFNYLKLTKNQDNFSVWNMTDPNMNKNYQGTDGTVGFVYVWDSINKNVGAGEQEITDIVDGKRIEYAIRFFRPMQNTGKSKFEIKPDGDQNSLVTWIFESPSKFPMSLFAPLFKIMLRKDISKGLVNLKTIFEKD